MTFFSSILIDDLGCFDRWELLLKLPVLTPEGRVPCASDAKPEPWSTDANWWSWRLMIWPVMPRHLGYPGIVGELMISCPISICWELASPNYLTWNMKKHHSIYQSQPPNVPQKPNVPQPTSWRHGEAIVILITINERKRTWDDMWLCPRCGTANPK